MSVDFCNGISIAKLPFLADVRLVLNENMTRKVHNGQVKKLVNSSNGRKAVIESENELQKLGYVDYMDNLSEVEKKEISENEVVYYIPWRISWNEKSLSTPSRLVFDVSQRNINGCSLNDLLAKGTNNMNNLIHVLIRWTTKIWGFHTDIQKMYNAVRLDKAHWLYQLYLLQENLDPQKETIKTLIFGVKSSGNQAE